MTLKYSLIPSNWDVLKEELAEPFENYENVQNYLEIASGKFNLELKGLNILNHSEMLPIFNFIRIQSLRLEEVFPEGKISILQQNFNMTLSLTREQILILLCHMALLSFKPTSRHFYWVNFENWLTDGRPCAMAYLEGLFSYFSITRNRLNTSWKTEMVNFTRKTYRNDILPLPDVSLNTVNLHLSGKIGDFSPNLIDFANEHIGFGISGTQEEVLFGSFIELCPAMIFCCDAMKDNEAIIIENAIKYASYEGYGFNLKYCSDGFDVQSHKSFNIIAIDALDFSGDYATSLQLQLNPSNLERELRKLIVGFSSINNDSIDTGHWGCGAFGGNKYLKVLLQMIAASVTGNKLSFCCFGDEQFYYSYKLFLSNCKFSANELWNKLLSLDPKITYFTFNDIISTLEAKTK